ncbi:hypothetical protein WJX73_005517 [Symbiochloris irregularis]|uniref:Pyruvate kinase n=1 Tax=Symbiochloris irregularis TaxID=706552 RepID=A0AAW1NWP5_9CHLO
MQSGVFSPSSGCFHGRAQELNGSALRAASAAQLRHTSVRCTCQYQPAQASGQRQDWQSSGASSTARGDVSASALAGYGVGISPSSKATVPSTLNVLEGEGELPAEINQFRKTKIVCTIGPTSCSQQDLFALADMGMNVVRLNMSHGDHTSHKKVVDLVKEYNSLGRRCLSIMLDTKGPEVRSGDLTEPLDLKAGDVYTFTTAEGANGTDGRISVNYDGFVDDVSEGDILLIDGGIMSFKILKVEDRDVTAEVVDGGIMKSRRHLNVRGKSANLPAITEKDWDDIKFGVEMGLDYFALSFVRNADVIYELKRYLSQRGAKIGVLAKIESADSISHLEQILDAVDGAMVARGDLGAELPVEQVPFWQSRIVQGCRKRGKPVIVATNMLESMIENPTPTRAEVSDIAVAVREGTDAIMLSGETAYGRFPFKSVAVMATVAKRTESSMLSYQGTRRYGTEESEPIDWIVKPGNTRGEPGQMTSPGLSEMFAYHATTMANTIRTSLVVFSRKGNMPALLSHYRPDYNIYMFTDDPAVQRRMAMYHGVIPLSIKFGTSADETFDRAIVILKERDYVKGGQQVAIVQSGRKPIWRQASTHHIQVRRVPKDPATESHDDSDHEHA